MPGGFRSWCCRPWACFPTCPDGRGWMERSPGFLLWPPRSWLDQSGGSPPPLLFCPQEEGGPPPCQHSRGAAEHHRHGQATQPPGLPGQVQLLHACHRVSRLLSGPGQCQSPGQWPAPGLHLSLQGRGGSLSPRLCFSRCVCLCDSLHALFFPLGSDGLKFPSFYRRVTECGG